MIPSIVLSYLGNRYMIKYHFECSCETVFYNIDIYIGRDVILQTLSVTFIQSEYLNRTKGSALLWSKELCDRLLMSTREVVFSCCLFSGPQSRLPTSMLSELETLFISIILVLLLQKTVVVWQFFIFVIILLIMIKYLSLFLAVDH